LIPQLLTNAQALQMTANGRFGDAVIMLMVVSFRSGFSMDCKSALSGNPKIYYLPNNTVWHAIKSSDQAMIDLKTVCRNLGVTLEKAVIVRASEFVGF